MYEIYLYTNIYGSCYLLSFAQSDTRASDYLLHPKLQSGSLS